VGEARAAAWCATADARKCGHRDKLGRSPSMLPQAGSQDKLEPRPTKISHRRQRLPGSMKLNRPLHGQRQRQRRPRKKQK